jgi:hypothetical protein
MREIVLLLGGWCVSLIAIGLLVGLLTRAITLHVLRAAESQYSSTVGAHRPPKAMVRSTASFVAAGVLIGSVGVGLLTEALGIRPPGAEPFTFAMYLLGVVPACAVGAALGAAMAASAYSQDDRERSESARLGAEGVADDGL